MEANATIMKALRNRLDSTGRTSSDESLSVHAVTKCTANPRNCGGSGGCSGATTELAFDMIQDSGIPLDVDQSWEVSEKSEAALCGESARREMLVSISGYEVLPSNKLHPLIQALYESGGPIGVSVDATTWFAYHGGILSDVGGPNTPGRFTINHAVVLVGYKMPKREDDGSAGKKRGEKEVGKPSMIILRDCNHRQLGNAKNCSHKHNDRMPYTSTYETWASILPVGLDLEQRQHPPAIFRRSRSVSVVIFAHQATHTVFHAPQVLREEIQILYPIVGVPVHDLHA